MRHRAYTEKTQSVCIEISYICGGSGHVPEEKTLKKIIGSFFAVKPLSGRDNISFVKIYKFIGRHNIEIEKKKRNN